MILTPDNLIRIVTEVARCELTTKVLGATYTMHSGVSEDNKCFWSQHGVADLYTLYKSEVTHEKVLNMIAEPVEMSASQNKVFEVPKTSQKHLLNHTTACTCMIC